MENGMENRKAQEQWSNKAATAKSALIEIYFPSHGLNFKENLAGEKVSAMKGLQVVLGALKFILEWCIQKVMKGLFAKKDAIVSTSIGRI